MTKEDCGSWIWTYSGHKVDLFNPDPNEIDIDDIAHALSMTCRFGGHTNKFYSVAEHSLIMSYMVKPEDRLAALLHDAAEYVLTDIPSPFKRQLPIFKELEVNFMKVICKKFDFFVPGYVNVLDKQIVRHEAELLLNNPEWTKDWPYPRIDGWRPEVIVGYDPANIREKFMERFINLCYGPAGDHTVTGFMGQGE